MTQWQPIETAPKDGTRLLLYCGKGKIAVGRFKEIPWQGACWTLYYEDSNDVSDISWLYKSSRMGFYLVLRKETQPTHWMPLPPPPATI